MTDPRHDPAMKAALDRFTVPPLPAGFADRVVVAVTAGVPAAAALPPLPPASPRRFARPWRRPSRIAAGVLAMTLMSAAAAATGYLGDRAQTITRALPVVGPMIASVVPPPPQKKQPTRRAEPPAIVRAPEADPPPVGTADPMTIAPQTRRDIRREVLAERLVDRLEARDRWRAEAGLPPAPPHPGQAIRVLRRIPPEDRRAVVDRVRELRQERAAAASGQAGAASASPQRPTMVENSPLPVIVDPQAADTSGAAQPDGTPRAPAWRNPGRLTPEQVERLRALREQRRQRLEQWRERQRAQSGEVPQDSPREGNPEEPR